jgi:hypothetical protein
MPVHPNEDLLHEILRLFAVADRAVHEVEESRLIALHQLLKRTLLSPEERSHDRRVVQRLELRSYGRPRRRYLLLQRDISHVFSPPGTP